LYHLDLCYLPFIYLLVIKLMLEGRKATHPLIVALIEELLPVMLVQMIKF